MTEPPRQVPNRVYLLLGFMVFVWSMNFAVAKLALKEFPALLLGSLRFTVAGAILFVVYLWRRRSGKTQPVERDEFWKLLGIGLVGVGLNQITFLLGLTRTSVGHASILICVTPVIVLLLSSWIGHEHLSHRKFLGFGLAVSGILVLQGRALLTGHGSMLGDLFVVLAATTFSIFTVGGKHMRHQFDSVTMMTFAYTGSGVVLFPVTYWLGSQFAFEKVSWLGWAAVLYMAVFPSIVAYLIFYHALRYLSSSRLSMLSYLQPFLATLFAIPLLGEKVTASLVAGGMLVIAGVWWSERTA